MTALPVISRCDEVDCFYNREAGCRAPAINVGGSHPRCDTFTRTGAHITRDPIGRVGACHVGECRWNKDLTCSAQAIVVGRHGDHPDCMTYEIAA